MTAYRRRIKNITNNIYNTANGLIKEILEILVFNNMIAGGV